MVDRKGSTDKNLADVTAAILAGGLGTRLRPVITDQPKVLAAIKGRPFLAYLLDQLSDVEVQLVVLCTGYRGEQVKAALGDSHGPLKLIYSQEQSPLGTGGALRKALPLFRSDPVLILNGDSYCDLNLPDFRKWHETRGARATVALVRQPDTGRFGRVRLGPDSEVIGFTEKEAEHGAGWINAGIYLLSRSLLQTISKDSPVSLEQEMFPSWIGQGLYGYAAEGRFFDISTPESYANANEFFAMEYKNP